jgi:di/tricarboxylate transporter
LLFAVEREHIHALRKNTQDFVLISEPKLPTRNMLKGWLGLGIITMVILLASFNILPILVSAIVGCLLMLFTRCIDAEHAYRAVDWKVIFLLAGAMSFGIALTKTGLADLIAEGMIMLAGGYGPIVLLCAVYLITSLLTEAMSNNATVVLLAPIVIAMAESLGISAKPFLMAITFAASSSFMTPIGYQTNTMVYAAGNYKFRDFFKV